MNNLDKILNKKIIYFINDKWIRFDVSPYFLKGLGEYFLTKYNTNLNIKNINFLGDVIEFCKLYEKNNGKFIIIKRSEGNGLDLINFEEENLVLSNQTFN